MIAALKNRVARHTHLARTFTGVGFAQGILQVISLLAGLLIVRFLPPEEYAYYTLAGGVLGFLSIITDSGMNSGAYAVAGKIWRDRQALGDLVATLIHLRRKFTTYTVIIAFPFMAALLWKNGASPFTIGFLCVACALQFWVTLPTLCYNLAPSLHQRILETQRISVAYAVMRLSCVAAILCVAKSSILLYLVAIPSQIWGNIRLKRLSDSLMEPGVIKAEYRKDLLRTVGKVFPGSLYYAFSGQITIFLVSLYGSTKTLADVGALSRLGQMMAVLSAVSAVLIIPRFARMENSPARLVRIYIGILAVAACGCALLCLAVYFFPGPALWLLGVHYSALGSVVSIQFISASVGLLCGIAYQLGAVRGVIYSPLLAIPAAIVYQGLSIFVFDFSRVHDVLLFSIGLFCLQGIQTIAYFIGTVLSGKTTS